MRTIKIFDISKCRYPNYGRIRVFCITKNPGKVDRILRNNVAKYTKKVVKWGNLLGFKKVKYFSLIRKIYVIEYVGNFSVL